MCKLILRGLLRLKGKKEKHQCKLKGRAVAVAASASLVLRGELS